MLARYCSAFAALGFTALLAAAPASAATMAECSAKYKAAQTAGTLKGQNWNDFRKANCGNDDAKTDAAKTTEPAAPKGPPPAGMTFPTAIAPKYAKETPGKARLHTCLDEYKALKAKNGLAGLPWIKKGGGYYSFCNAKLKGAS